MLPKDAVTNALSIHDLRAFFPHASPQRILKYGGVLLDSIGRANRWGNSTFPAYCIATIAAETSNFNPSAPEGLTLPEDGVRYPNTLTETRPFGAYEKVRNRLGNVSAPSRISMSKIYEDYVDPKDGENYRGRGFVQLTGRANYAKYGQLTGLDLLMQPELAAIPEHSIQILVVYVATNWHRIGSALERHDLVAARVAVNGGSNGLGRFVATYRKVLARISPSDSHKLERSLIEKFMPNERGAVES